MNDIYFQSLVPVMHGSIFYETMSKIHELSRQKNHSCLLPQGMLFNRTEWTFHAKGLWLQRLDHDSHVCTSYIGSSNLGMRSWTRDFELGFIIVSCGGKNRNSKISNIFRRDWMRLISHADSTSCSEKLLSKTKLARYLSLTMKSYL